MKFIIIITVTRARVIIITVTRARVIIITVTRARVIIITVTHARVIWLFSERRLLWKSSHFDGGIFFKNYILSCLQPCIHV